jgi:hypothetical protein
MWKVLMVQSCDNDILEGLAVTNPPQTQNPLFLEGPAVIAFISF